MHFASCIYIFATYLDSIKKLNAKMLLNIIVKIFKKADDVSALLIYAIIKSKVIKVQQEYIKRETIKIFVCPMGIK